MAASEMHSIISNFQSAFPVKTSQTSVEFNNIRTELVCTKYQDRIFFVVTQYGKIGTLVSITRDNIVSETGDIEPICSTDVLMGKDEPLTHVIAKNLVSNIVIQKPVLLSVALKDSSPNTVKTLAQILPKLL